MTTTNANRDDSSQHYALEALESARRYNEWVASLAQPYLGVDAIEIGSGTGVYAEIWLRNGLERLTTSEVDPVMLRRLRERFADDPRVTVADIDLSHPGRAEHTGLVAMNVLEHIADDVSALQGATQLVQEGGNIVVFVPAFGFAAGRFDHLVGHHRRYTKASLRATFEAAGLEMQELRYINAPGLLAWTLVVRVLGRNPTAGPAVRVWDTAVMPAVRLIESCIRMPFGQSVLGVGRRP